VSFYRRARRCPNGTPSPKPYESVASPFEGYQSVHLELRSLAEDSDKFDGSSKAATLPDETPESTLTDEISKAPSDAQNLKKRREGDDSDVEMSAFQETPPSAGAARSGTLPSTLPGIPPFSKPGTHFSNHPGTPPFAQLDTDDVPESNHGPLGPFLPANYGASYLESDQP